MVTMLIPKYGYVMTVFDTGLGNRQELQEKSRIAQTVECHAFVIGNA